MIPAFPPAPVAGRWFVPSLIHQIDTTLNGPADLKVFYYPFRVTRNITIDRLATFLGVDSGWVGGRLRIGIYSDNDGLPGTLLVDSGDMPLTPSAVNAATIILSLNSNAVYWMATAWDRNGVASADTVLPGTVAFAFGANFYVLPSAVASDIIQDATNGDGGLTADITSFTVLPAAASLTNVARQDGPPRGFVAVRIKAGGGGFGPYATGMHLVFGVGTDRAIAPGITTNSANDAVTVVDGDLVYYPFSVPYAITVKTLGIVVNTTKVGNVNVAIYADSAGTPGARLVETGNIDTNVGGDREIDVTDTALQARKNYWMALIYDGAAGMKMRGRDRPGASASSDYLVGLGGTVAADVIDPNAAVLRHVSRKITGETGTTLSDPAKVAGLAYSSDDLPMAFFTYVTQG